MLIEVALCLSVILFSLQCDLCLGFYFVCMQMSSTFTGQKYRLSLAYRRLWEDCGKDYRIPNKGTKWTERTAVPSLEAVIYTDFLGTAVKLRCHRTAV